MRDVTPLPLPAKARLAARIWLRFALVALGTRRRPFPRYVERLGRPAGRRAERLPPERLSRAVDRSLRLGGRRPRCLLNALVLFRLLREQGDDAELVIGLPVEALTKDAHAWVELDGRDVGPPPGRGEHEALARFR